MKTDSSDFIKQVSDLMGPDWKRDCKFHFISPKVRKSKTHTKGFFPVDAPKKRFDVLWFCGCDALYFKDDEFVILDTDEMKKRLHKHGAIVFTDARGEFEHKYNKELEHGGGWVLDVRAYIKHAKEQKTYWKNAMEEDEDDEFTKEAFDDASDHLAMTNKLVKTFLRSFKRTRDRTYIAR